VLSWKKDYKEARALLEQLAREDPKDAELPLRLAEVTLWSGDYDRAVTHFQALLEANFEQPDVWRSYVDAAASSQNLKEVHIALAVRIYERLGGMLSRPNSLQVPQTGLKGRESMAPEDDVVFLARLAWLLHRGKEADKAKSLLAKVLAMHPVDAAVRKNLAGTLAAVGNYIEALRMYEGLPLDLDDRYHLVGITASAAQQYRAALDVHPDDKEARSLATYVAGWKKVNQESLALFEKLGRAAPQDRQLQVRLAELSLWSGDYNRALVRFQALLDDDFEQRQLWRSYVDAAASAEMPLTQAHRRTALRLYERMATAETKVEYLSRLAWMLYRLKETARVEKLLDRAMSLRPTEAAVRKELAGVLAAAGRHQLAWQMYEGLKLTTADRLHLAELHAAGSHFDAAEKEVRAVLAVEPDNFKAQLFLAAVLSWNKKYAEADELYHKLLRIHPDDKVIPIRLAELALWKHDYDAALVQFQALLDKDVDRTQLWAAYIDAASSAKKLTETCHKTVRHIYEKIQQTKMQDPVLLGRMAWVLRRVNEPEKGIALLKKGLELDPSSRAIRLRLAEALYEQGDHEEAEKHFKILLQSPPPRGPKPASKPDKP
jgi:tetratricopeptide (TPR) repeat protein